MAILASKSRESGTNQAGRTRAAANPTEAVKPTLNARPTSSKMHEATILPEVIFNLWCSEGDEDLFTLSFDEADAGSLDEEEDASFTCEAVGGVDDDDGGGGVFAAGDLGLPLAGFGMVQSFANKSTAKRSWQSLRVTRIVRRNVGLLEDVAEEALEREEGRGRDERFSQEEARRVPKREGKKACTVRRVSEGRTGGAEGPESRTRTRVGGWVRRLRRWTMKWAFWKQSN